LSGAGRNPTVRRNGEEQVREVSIRENSGADEILAGEVAGFNIKWRGAVAGNRAALKFSPMAQESGT